MTDGLVRLCELMVKEPLAGSASSDEEQDARGGEEEQARN
jgi:hypothetical protein